MKQYKDLTSMTFGSFAVKARQDAERYYFGEYAYISKGVN
jgi:hypothetical protein